MEERSSSLGPTSLSSISLFHEVFGFSKLGTDELKIDNGKVYKIGRNILHTPQGQQSSQTTDPMLVLKTVKAMLSNEKGEKQTRDVRKKAKQVYKKIIESHGLDKASKAKLASEIDTFIIHEEIVKIHEEMVKRGVNKEDFEEQLLNAIHGTEGKRRLDDKISARDDVNQSALGADIFRYIGGRNVQFSDSKDSDMLANRRVEKSEVFEKEGHEVSNCLDIFLEKLGYTEKDERGLTRFNPAASKIIHAWEHTSDNKDVQLRCTIFFNQLISGDLGKEGKKVAKLFLGLNQNVRMGLVKHLITTSTVIVGNEKEKLVSCKKVASSEYRFIGEGPDAGIKLIFAHQLINWDNKPIADSDQTECRYRIVLQHSLESKLSDLEDWTINSTILIGHVAKEDKQAADYLETLKNRLEIAGFKPTSFTTQNVTTFN